MSMGIKRTFDLKAFGFSVLQKKLLVMLTDTTRMELALQCLEEHVSSHAKLDLSQTQKLNELTIEIAVQKAKSSRKFQSTDIVFTETALQQAVTTLLERQHPHLHDVHGKTADRMQKELGNAHNRLSEVLSPLQYGVAFHRLSEQVLDHICDG